MPAPKKISDVLEYNPSTVGEVIGYKVVSVFFHQPIGIPGFTSASMLTMTPEKQPNIQMNLGSVDGIKGLILKGKDKNKRDRNAIVTEHNCAYLEYETC